MKEIEILSGYMINEIGEIFSLNYRHTGKKQKMKQSFDKDGYKVINMGKGKDRKIYKVHRLIALAFILNSENKPHINHINGIKDDNRIKNLEWCTPKENIKHTFDKLNRIIPNKENAYNRKKVKNKITNIIYETQLLASKATNTPQPTISYHCMYKKKTANGNMSSNLFHIEDHHHQHQMIQNSFHQMQNE